LTNLKKDIYLKLMEEIILFSGEGCPACDEVKKHLKNPSRIKIVDVTKDEDYARLAFENDILAIPTVAIKTSDGIKKCELKFEGNTVKAKCGNKEIIL